jgi:hypothetical protein
MRIVLKIDKIAAGLLFVFLGTLSAYSQSTTSLRGVIADPSGAVIPGAAVAIRSVENGANRREMTMRAGNTVSCKWLLGPTVSSWKRRASPK